MLPPDPPPPDLPTPVANGHSREPRRGAETHKANDPVEHDRVRMPPADMGGRRPLALVRLLLLALSTAGVGVAFVLLTTGQLALAGRVLAGDVLLIFAILVIV